jgi:hypothetical protein
MPEAGGPGGAREAQAGVSGESPHSARRSAARSRATRADAGLRGHRRCAAGAEPTAACRVDDGDMFVLAMGSLTNARRFRAASDELSSPVTAWGWRPRPIQERSHSRRFTRRISRFIGDIKGYRSRPTTLSLLRRPRGVSTRRRGRFSSKCLIGGHKPTSRE